MTTLSQKVEAYMARADRERARDAKLRSAIVAGAENAWAEADNAQGYCVIGPRNPEQRASEIAYAIEYASVAKPESMADKLNAKLADGWSVQISTYGRATVYGKRHAGWFKMDGKGNLCVKRGRGSDCLSIGERLLVAVRVYRLA